mmetsp:Transcript_32961/g.75939  ORF Transcript_32961/g.75939 Transcript_32961/m.75939 type:complete len:84 (-) Transcript_32961:159-410(-)
MSMFVVMNIEHPQMNKTEHAATLPVIPPQHAEIPHRHEHPLWEGLFALSAALFASAGTSGTLGAEAERFWCTNPVLLVGVIPQ